MTHAPDNSEPDDQDDSRYDCHHPDWEFLGCRYFGMALIRCTTCGRLKTGWHLDESEEEGSGPDTSEINDE